MLFFERKQNLSALLPERLSDVVEINALCSAIEKEIDAANTIIAAAESNSFVVTALESGISRWENITGISSPINSSLQARRDAVIARLMTKAPINIKVLKSIIEAYMGLEVELEIDLFYIHIRYRGQSRITDLIPLYVTINDIIPANMIADIAYKYLVWSELDSLTMSFTELDEIKIIWADFEKGEWING